jgi:hypothetical protein
MSHSPDEVLSKLQEVVMKYCDASIKALELIEQEKKNDYTVLSDEQITSAKIFIEKLSVFQNGTFVKGDQIMNKTEIEVTLGDNAKISGDFVVAKSIENSFNKINLSETTDELKGLLKELSVVVSKMIEHLPEEEGEEVAEDFDTLVDKATCEKPKRKWWSVSIEGLSNAAKNLGEIGTPVLDLIGKIVPILTSLST